MLRFCYHTARLICCRVFMLLFIDLYSMSISAMKSLCLWIAGVENGYGIIAAVEWIYIGYRMWG